MATANHTIIIQNKVHLSEDYGRVLLSCSGPFTFLLSKTFKLFGFQIFWHWAVIEGFSKNASYTLN